MSGEIYYPQNEHEKNYFNYLWDVANSRPPAAPGASDLTGELSGLAAVTFFQRSGVDKGFLKQIWSLSTPVATMNIHQFYVALRFIAMIQNGEMPISKEKLIATSKEKFELPKFNGIDLPRPVAAAPAPVPVAPTAATAAAANASAAFAITPPEHVKYHSLFVNYDTDRDGFLSRDEAIPILRQSGLDPRLVDTIFSFADDDRDSRLTGKEFSAAFHMIVCVSKRGQPLPAALPPSLKLFLLNAPAVPGDAASAGIPPVTATAPIQSVAPVSVPAPVAAPAPVEVKKQDISSAFSSFDEPSAVSSTATASVGASHGNNVADDADIRNSLDAMKTATKKTIAAHEVAVEINGKAYSSLQGIKQRLATDRIALEATVANAVVANQEAQVKLDQVTAEIQALQEQIRQLTARLQETSQHTSSSQNRLVKAQEEKQQLLREIDQLLRQIDTSQSDSLQLTEKLTNAEREVSRLESENKALTRTSAALKSDISDLTRENEDLRRIASSLRERAGQGSSHKQNLDTRVTLASDKVQSQKQTNQQLQKQVQIETQTVVALKEEKKQLIQQITGSPASAASGSVPSAVSVASSSPLSGFDGIASDFPSTKTVASASAITTGTFDDLNDDPFGGSSGFASENLSSKSPQISSSSKKVSGGIAAFEAEDPFGGFGDDDKKTTAAVVEDPFNNVTTTSTTTTTSSEPDPFAGFSTTATSNTKNEDPFFESSFPSTSSAPTSPAPVKPPKPTTPKAVVVAAEDPFGSSSPSNNNTSSDPFGGFDDPPQSTKSNHDSGVDDPFAGFDDNVPLPKTTTTTTNTSPLPSSSSTKTVSADPFSASSTISSHSKVVDDPFAGPTSSTSNTSGGFGDEFAVFDDTNTGGSSSSHKGGADPFANFEANISNTNNSFGDDGFGSTAAFSDPFGGVPATTTSTSNSQKKDEDDPFAGFD